MILDHLRTDIPGSVDDDGTWLGIAVLGIEPEKATGTAMLALINILGEIGAPRGCGRAGLI